MKRLLLMTCAACLSIAAALPSGAAELLGKESFELTPFYGYRIGGHFNGIIDAIEYPFDSASSYGGLIDINLKKNNFKVEALWSHQKTGFDRILNRQTERTRLEIDHLQGGIMQEVGQERARFAISVLLGASRLKSPGLGSETRFSGSIGGDIKLFPTAHVGIRLDARAYGIFTKGAAGAFCVNGACAFAYSGTVLWQGDFTGGLILAF